MASLFFMFCVVVAGLATVARSQSQTCWSTGLDGEGYSFELCCRMYVQGVQGYPQCWSGDFTYETCCAAEMRDRLQVGLSLIAEGQYRQASDQLLDLHMNFARGANAQVAGESWFGFEKATKEMQQSMNALPGELSYFDVVFDGLGVECDADEQVGRGTFRKFDGDFRGVFADFNRCCRHMAFSRSGCLQVLEMLSAALGKHMRRIPGGEDTYYRDFSQHWSFHHFTPSVLSSSDVLPGDPEKHFQRAKQMNPELAAALTAEAEPHLGIVWAEHVPDYLSPKFLYGTFFLTLALGSVQLTSSGRPVDIFEIGAGYGSLPRMAGAAQQRLRELPTPLDVRSYTIFDLRSIADLQRWYLNSTLGDRVHIRDSFSLRESSLQVLHDDGQPRFTVNLVVREQRDLFSHLYSDDLAAVPPESRPIRLLIAVNSWHEQTMAEFFWYYNMFVKGLSSGLAADWILYVSNVEWPENDEKEALLLNPRNGFIVYAELCTATNCVRLFQRVQ